MLSLTPALKWSTFENDFYISRMCDRFSLKIAIDVLNTTDVHCLWAFRIKDF